MSSTTFSKGVQFGGDKDFKIRHGGAIRYSLPINASTTFLEGAAVQVNASGEIQATTGQNTMLTGITSTRRQTVDDQENDQTIGSGKAVIITDYAIIETAQLTSGAVFAINSKVYQDEAGKWTNSNPSTDHRVYGTALTAAVANAGDILTMQYYGAQGPA